MRDRIRDWMSCDPFSVREAVSALEALDEMIERGIRHLPVVDATRRVIGILTIDDLRAALPFEVAAERPLGPMERHDAREYRVSDAMTWAPQTARASDSLEEAAQRLADHRIGCLPVVDEDERLEGIFTETDALHALSARLHGPAPPARAAPPHGSDALVDALWAEHERLVEQLAKWQAAERAIAANLRDEPRDSGDCAIEAPGSADPKGLAKRASGRLRAIEGALRRAEQGRLGICEQCQGRIPATRLRALPEATLCVRCARTTAQARGRPDGT